MILGRRKKEKGTCIGFLCVEKNSIGNEQKLLQYAPF